MVETLRARFHRGVAWSIAAALASSGFNFVLNIITARLLGRERFGEFGMVLTTIATVAGIAQVAMGYTATKFVAEFRSSDPARAGRVIGLSGLVSLTTGSLAATALCVGAPWLATKTLGAPHLSVSLQLASVTVFFAVLVGYQMGSLAGLESYRSLATLAVASGAANLVAAPIGCALWGIEGAIGGMGVGAMLQWVMFRWAMERECRREGISVCRTNVLSERAILVSFALPAALGGLFSMPAIWLANAFLARQTDGFSQLALYTAAFSVRSIVFFLPSLFNRVSMSLLNNQRGLRNLEGYSRVFRVNIGLSAGTAIMGAAFVAVAGVRILSIFGKDFRAGFPILLLLLAAAVVEALTASLYQVVQAESRMWASTLVIGVPRDLLIVLLSHLLSPRLGGLGLATAYTAGWTLACVATAVVVGRIGIRPQWSAAVAGRGNA